MVLAIDIGNTHLVLGISKGDQLVHSWRVVTRRNQTFDEYAVLFRNLFELEGILRNMKENWERPRCWPQGCWPLWLLLLQKRLTGWKRI